jgi:hypothetical protein
MRSRLLLAALLGASLAVAPARADDAAEKEGRALFKQASQKVADGDLVDALDLYRSSYARLPSPKTLVNIATVLNSLGRYAEAANTYQEYLDHAVDPARKADVEKLLLKLDARVGRLRVTVDDPRATVRVDGKVLDAKGGVASVRAEPGPHAVSAEGEGVPPVTMNVTTVAGQETPVTLHVARPPPPPAPPPEPPSPPPARVLPPPPPPVLVPVPPVVVDRRADLHPAASRGRRVAGLVFGGAGAVGLGLAAGFGIDAVSKANASSPYCTASNQCEQTGLDLRGAAVRSQTAGLVSAGIGAALVATGVVLFVTAPSASGGARVGVTVVPSGAALDAVW